MSLCLVYAKTVGGQLNKCFQYASLLKITQSQENIQYTDGNANNDH